MKRFALPKLGPGLFRLMLACAVFIAHTSRFDIGRPAVMLFFMLSGYWVARMQDGPHHQGYFGFILSRFLRIWPQLVVTAILTFSAYQILKMPVSGSLISTIALLGLASRHNDILGVTWSLDIEAQFYLLLPAILFLKKALSSQWLLLLFSVVSFAAGFAIFKEIGDLTVFLYFPVFAAGIAVYFFRWKASGKLAFWSIAVGSVSFIIIGQFLRPLLVTQFDRDVAYIAGALLVCPFISWNVRLPSGDFDRFLGNLSYPFYLVHEPCLMILRVFTPIATSKILGFLATTILSGALYASVDRPSERFRTFLRNSHANTKLTAAS